MSIKKTIAAFAVGLPSMMACGTSITYSPLNPAPHAMKKKPPHQVVMFVGKRPKRAYVEVGLLEAQQESVYSGDDREAIIRKMREDAGERGCDGLIVTGKEDSTTGSYSEGTGYTTTLKGYQATCIVWDASADDDEEEAPKKPKKKSKKKSADDE
jgi:hypothetical protein